MTPPTGLTFIIHALVVVVRKVLRLFGIDSPKSKQCGIHKPEIKNWQKKANIYSSVAVVLFVGVYMFWLVSVFVARAAGDQYANWKVAGKTIHSLASVVDHIKLPSPPILPPESVAHEDVTRPEAWGEIYVPHQFFSDKSSPFINLYTKHISFISQNK